jgi:hypothetical protein
MERVRFLSPEKTMLHIVALLVAVFVLSYVWQLSGAQEKFQPELRDTSQDRRTQNVENSSYEQRTNHMPAMSFVEAATGLVTPFRVNAYTALM